MATLASFSSDGGKTLCYPLAPGVTSSRLVLGCMHFAKGGDMDGASTLQKAVLALETVLGYGWDTFDLADIYGRGESEVVFGKAVRQLGLPRESIIVQSKCGIRFAGEPHASDPHRFDFSRRHILDSVEGSLRRLGMDYLDLLLLHRPDFLADPEEVLTAFAELQATGKVLAFGVSNFTPPLLDLFRSAGFIPVVHQVEISLLKHRLITSTMVSEDREPMPASTPDGTLEWHRQTGVVTQAWAPLAYGYPCGRAPDWEPGRVGATAARVREMAAEVGAPPEAVVIAWLLRHPAMIQPVIGTLHPQRLKACHQALDLSLSREAWYRLLAAARSAPLP